MESIILNTQAVFLMRQGNFQGAISVCWIALDELLSRGPEDQHEDVSRIFLSVSSIHLEDHFSLLKPSSYQDDHTFTLFDRALIFDNAELAAVSSDAAQNCVSAVLLFNMGLAFHIQGVCVHNLRSQTTNFKKAMKLYEMAIEILEGCKGCDDELNGLLHLSLFNNMGHICSHFGETKHAKRCFKWMQAVLQAMECSDEDIHGEEFVPFHVNVLVLRGHDALAAGAA
jgi:tetratricopeptide (TPR) repeat protein